MGFYTAVYFPCEGYGFLLHIICIIQNGFNVKNGKSIEIRGRFPKPLGQLFVIKRIYIFFVEFCAQRFPNILRWALRSNNF